MKPQTHLINNLKKFFSMQNKSHHSGSFNLQNATAQDLRQMIETGNLPNFLTSQQRDRIMELFHQGDTFGSIRKLQGIIEGQNVKPGKTLL